MIVIPCMPPGWLCETRGGVLVSTVTLRKRIAGAWYISDVISPLIAASPWISYGPLSEIT